MREHVTNRGLAVALVLAVASLAGAAADPAQPGKFRVGVATVTAVDNARGGRALPTEIWYPARVAGRDAQPLAKSFPLIMMAHGFCGSRLNYEYLTAHLASHGFVVAAPDFVGTTSAECEAGTDRSNFDDYPFDMSFVCRMLHDKTGPLATYAKHVRGIPTGQVGHSLGGAVVVVSAQIDPSFTATVGLAPFAQAPDAVNLADLIPQRAWMVMGGTADTLITLENLTPFFDALPAPAFLVSMTGGTHGGFSDRDSRLTPEELAAQQDAVKRAATPFFFRYLAHKPKFGKRLRSFDDGAVALTARTK
jgi:dienelactone hydrolase